jgi:hypothetical protein
MRLRTKDLINKRIKDAQGRSCPEKVRELLHAAGIVSIGCRKGRLNWDVVGADARSLAARLGRKAEEE